MTTAVNMLHIRSIASRKGAKSRYQAAVARAVVRDPRPVATHVSFSLASLPPSVNGLYANTENGRMKTAAYAAWLKEMLAELRYVQRIPLVSGFVRVSYQLVRPQSKIVDLGNRLKAADDLLVKARIIEDDWRIMGYDKFEWIAFASAPVLIEVRAVNAP